MLYDKTNDTSIKIILIYGFRAYVINVEHFKFIVRRQNMYVSGIIKGEKGRDPTQSCDKNPYTQRTIQRATWQHKNATKNFDYTTIADRPRTVS